MSTDPLLTPPLALSFFDAMKANGQVLPATAAAGSFGAVVTNPGTLNGTSLLVAEVANSSTITDKVFFDMIFPSEVHEGDTFPLTVSAQALLAASAAGTCTLSASVQAYDHTGTLGANLVTPASISVTPALSPAGMNDYVFTATDATFGAGTRLLVGVTMVVVASNANNITGSIGSIRMG